MSTTWTILLNIASIVGCYLAGMYIRRWIDRRRDSQDKSFSDPGYSVEVDCRECGRFNRVPGHRLRDKPKCGKCKKRLMPGKRLVVCRMSSLDRRVSAELNTVWKDEDRLWAALADHVMLDAKAKAEAKDPSRRMVN